MKQKWTTTAWTQDNSSVSYLTNPRVTETNVYDADNNRRRVTIDYGPYAQWGLPYLVREYGSNGTTEIRDTYTDYNLSQQYLDQRIIGLVSAVHGSNTVWWQTKISYGYDDPAQLQATPVTTTRHDAAYGSSFTARGNLTSVTRWDTTDGNTLNDQAKALISRVGYDTNGSAVWSKDPLNHQSSFSYTDSFSDSINRNTFAFPTMATDADGFSSTAQYNFDFGAVTRTQGPPPAGQSQGIIQTMLYDGAGRTERVTTQNNGAYTKYVYGPNYVQSFSTVNTIADEAYAIQVFDGAGRVFSTANNHPGSAGGYRLLNTIYDRMGRAIQQSNPTEVNNSWAPVGDDAVGVYYTQQTYDWQGRPLVTTNPDGTQKYAEYGGCGCAGGAVVTLTDEVGRQQKVYSDVLGRQWKAEVLNWDGTVYSTVTNTYNGRDQVTEVRQYQGTDQSGVYQETSMRYDGYGRLQTKHVPEQNVGTATVYAYNPDDTIQSVTDARGASATYSYNNRHLVTSINYSAPSGITPTPNGTFGYDAAGNRSSMTDGLGNMTYAYDQHSRMTSETRTFTGVGDFTIGYQYNLANQLSSITNPYNSTVSYARDAAGRVTSVTGTEVPTYTANIQYRAWGAVKHRNHPNGWAVDATFNSRMEAASFTVTSTISKTYDYYADGRLRFSSDHRDHRFDRYYTFDHAGRISEAFSGAEGRFEAPTTNRPYRQTYGYDALGHLTARDMKRWYLTWSMSDSYTNNRHAGWGYDADGRPTSGPEGPFTHDAAGRNTYLETSSNGNTGVFGYDGDGRLLKSTESTYDGEISYVTETKHFVRSSVLGGQVLTELLDSASSWTYIYAGMTVFAREMHFFGGSAIQWEDKDPSGATVWLGGVQQELDPTGADNGTYMASEIPDEGAFASYGSSYNPANPTMSYSIDGIRTTLDGFIGRLGHFANDPVALMEVASQPVGYRSTGYVSGRSFEVTTDINRNVTSVYIGGYDPSDELAYMRTELTSVSAIYGSWSQLAALIGTPQNSRIRDVTPILNKIRFLGDNANNPKLKSMLQVRLMSLLSKGCADAFKRAELATPEEIINKGITIADRPLLDDPSNNATLGLSERTQQFYSNSTADALTIRSQFTSKGPIIFFRAAAYADLDYLDEAVAHEFIHAAGVDQHPLWGYRLGRGTDLSGYEHYQDIIDHCGFPRYNR